MNASPDAIRRVGPLGVGEAWAVVTALAYTVTNLLLRAAAVHIDPWLGSLLRQVPTAALAWAVVIVMRSPEIRLSSPRFLGWGFMASLVGSGTVSFVIGNVFYFNALASGGLGVSVSAAQAGVILAALLIGIIALRERPNVLAYAGMAILIGGLVLVGVARRDAPEGWLLGLAYALGAGACWAIANVLTRLVQRSRPTIFVALAAASLGGLGPLLIIQVVRGGGNPLAGADPGQVAVVLAAGCFNALALVGIVQSLRSTTVAVSSSIQSGAVVFSFVGAVVLFGEAAPPLMVVGVIAVTAGIVLAQWRQPPARGAIDLAAPH